MAGWVYQVRTVLPYHQVWPTDDPACCISGIYVQYLVPAICVCVSVLIGTAWSGFELGLMVKVLYYGTLGCTAIQWKPPPAEGRNLCREILVSHRGRKPLAVVINNEQMISIIFGTWYQKNENPKGLDMRKGRHYLSQRWVLSLWWQLWCCLVCKFLVWVACGNLLWEWGWLGWNRCDGWSIILDQHNWWESLV